MVGDFDVDSESGGDKDVDYQIDERNFIKDVVKYSRSKQLLNEQPTILTSLTYITGLLPDSEDYTGAMIRGASGDGKSHMKMRVVDDMFMLAQDKHEWLYNTTSGSAKSMIDDEELDEARIGALDEMNKMPEELLEMLKSLHGDDGGFSYKRNVADPESESGRKTVNIDRDPLSFVFMLADENDMEVEQELETRLMDIKVDGSPQKNRGVHRMNWGHEELEIEGTDASYIKEDEDLWHAVRSHIRDIPVDTPVLIPTGDNNYRGDTWDAAHITEPLFDFEQSRSARASNTCASLIKASALANYHARNSVGIEVDGEVVEHIVADKADVANLLACRPSLLALTHGLTDKKFALIDAIKENGTPTDMTQEEYGAELAQILDYVESAEQMETMKKKEVRELLDEMNEQYLIDKTDHPDDGRKNYYKYKPRDTLQAPNIRGYEEEFDSIENPITGESLTETVERQQTEFGVNALGIEDVTADEFMGSGGSDSSDSEGAESGLEAFGSGDDPDTSSYSELEQRVHTRLSDTLDGKVIPEGIVESDSMKVSHMVGASPIIEDDVNGETWVEPERAAKAADKTDGLYDGFDSIDTAEEEIDAAVRKLRADDVFQFHDHDDGMKVEVADL